MLRAVLIEFLVVTVWDILLITTHPPALSVSMQSNMPEVTARFAHLCNDKDVSLVVGGIFAQFFLTSYFTRMRSKSEFPRVFATLPALSSED